MIDGLPFRLTDCNRDYQLCPTYPRQFMVAACVNDTVIRHASRFRSHNRLPVLSFCVKKGGTIGVLIRAAQPLTGVTMRRSTQDEYLVRSMSAVSTTQKLIIVDARGMTSIMANAVQGRGTESVEHYKAERMICLNLPNMHAVREWLPGRGEAEGEWGRGVKRVVEAARVVAGLLEEGCAVLVHCSDGWDRTPQLTSLAYLLSIDSTSDGKISIDKDDLLWIINREWLSMGHKFSTRHSHNRPLSHHDDEVSPIFVQFLDCIRLLTDDDEIVGFVGELERLSFDPRGPFRGDCERDRLCHV